MTDGFSQAVYGISPAEPDSDEIVLLGRSEGITIQSADLWRIAASLDARPESATTGVFQLDTHHLLLARVTHGAGRDEPVYRYIRLPKVYVRRWGGNLRGLLYSIRPRPELTGASLPNVKRHVPQPWDTQERRRALDALIEHVGGLRRALALLDAAVSRERLLIHSAKLTEQERLDVIAGIAALLPASARADLTFSTYVGGQRPNLTGRVVFGVVQERNRRVHYDWTGEAFDTPYQLSSAYVNQFAAFGDEDVDAAVELVDAFDTLAASHRDVDLVIQLDTITEQFRFYEKANAADDDTPVDPEGLKRALVGASTLPPAWRSQYAGLLLVHALEEKDTEAVSLIAGEMDDDETLDATLSRRMYDMLQDTPDLIYVFMRQRLSEGASERWQERLHDAAEHSLNVAFESGDPDLVLSWLRLLAREPERFDLDEMLQNGVQRALPFAYDNSGFALDLLVLVCRFMADLINPLLDDENLIRALPDDVRDAFMHHERDALAELQNQSTSLFLAGVGRAAEARAGTAFEARVLERVWGLDKSDRKYNQRSPYVPASILEICATTGATWLPSTAAETFLGLLLTERENPLYSTFTEHLAAEDLLAERLPGALVRADSDPNTMLDVITMLASAEKLTVAGTKNVYVTCLNILEWRNTAQPMMGALARLLQQHSAVEVTVQTATRLLERAAALKDEFTARVAALQLLENAARVDADEATDDRDERLVDRLRLVFTHLAWSVSARPAVLTWWRSFVQGQPSVRLSRLDGALEGVRVLEDARETLRSVAAMRRLIGKRDVASFAEAINTAYEVLETLAESFEPQEKGSDISFDPETIRATLVHMTDELTPHQRQILSNSLKGLAGLIARMGDNRTKAGLARRGDSVDRQLIAGEQMPGGAVDAMKWMAGFFSGAQTSDDDD